MIHDIGNDVRYAFRTLSNARVASLTTVMTLGIGIGLLTAVFSIVNAAVLRPLPYESSTRLVALGEDHPRAYPQHSRVSPAVFDAVRNGARSLSGVEAYETANGNVVLGPGQSADQLSGVNVTPGIFAVLGVPPFRGRLFTPDETTAGSNVLVISHELWASRLGANERVIGSTARVDGVPHTIVGVMPPGFNFPERDHYWRPLVMRSNSPERLERSLSVVARLRDGVDLASARAEIATIGAALARAYPTTQSGWSLVVRPDAIERRPVPAPIQWMILVAGTFLMLIACANVTTVLLARAAARRPEMAVRAALGGSRQRLIRQQLTETLILALAGGFTGLLLATWMLDLAWASVPTQNIPSWIDLGVDWRVLAFTSAASFVALLAVGIGPALTATRVRLSDPLKLGSSGDTASRRELRASRVLVVVEVAAAFVLFAGSALMLDSFRSMQHVDFGIEADRVLIARPSLSPNAYSTEARRRSYFDLAMHRVQQVPGVTSVATRGMLDSLRGAAWSTDSLLARATIVPLGGRQQEQSLRTYDVDRSVVTPEYFTAVKLPLVRGRLFTAQDDSGSARVAVISARLAERLWPNVAATGRQFRFAASAEWVTVVGVVGDVRRISGGNRGTRTVIQPTVYFPAAQATSRYDALVVQAADPIGVASTVGQALRAVDPDQSIGRLRRLSDEMESPNLGTLWLGAVFAAIAMGALILASIGLYGVIAYSVTRRTREIGVRMALGADARSLHRTVVAQALRLTAIGLGIGAIGAWALVRVTGTFLGGEGGSLVAASAVVALVFVVCGAAASAVPARRATRVDPLVALRAQ